MKRMGTFPFCAVLGQENMKQALLWNVVNPKIGGVLLCGEKGTAKSTVVRGLADLLSDVCVVELPLNVTEDRLVGSIDIEAAVKDGVRRFEPGILKAADKNFLYIDEVNLLSDHIINCLLETAASGVNHVEREGTSYTHPSRFYLVGSMNPEEGKLRPQFLDRFGLYVTVESTRDVRERAEIVQRELEYERNSLKFLESYREEQEELKKRIFKAQKRLPKVAVTEAAMKLAAVISEEANCAGQRGELVIVETARAIAAWDERITLNLDDIKKAAEFALPHRMREAPKEPSHSEQEDNSREDEEQNGGDEPEEAREENAGEEAQKLESSEEEANEKNGRAPKEPNKEEEFSGEGEDRLEDDRQEEKSGSDGRSEEEIQEIGRIFKVCPWIGESGVPTVRMGSGRRSIVRTTTLQGRYVKAVNPHGDIRDIAFDATFRAAAPHQKFREHNGMALAVKKEDIRTKIREKRAGNTILFVVDASGSMGANKRMTAVKGAICSLLNDAYQKRDQVGMIAFRKRSAELILDITRSVDLARKKLEVLPTGGRTPLSAGLLLARQVFHNQKQKDKDCLPVMVLLSDGRANAAMGDGNPVKEALQEAAKIRGDGIKCVVIDTEKDYIRLKLAQDLAKELKADYFKIEDLDADTLTGIVSQAANS